MNLTSGGDILLFPLGHRVLRGIIVDAVLLPKQAALAGHPTKDSLHRRHTNVRNDALYVLLHLAGIQLKQPAQGANKRQTRCCVRHYA